MVREGWIRRVGWMLCAVALSSGCAASGEAPGRSANTADQAPADLPGPDPRLRIETDGTYADSPHTIRPVTEPAEVGQPTEQASNAFRLAEQKRWDDAALALLKVAKGEAGDDEGNKQKAELQLAIALHELKMYRACYALFRDMAKMPAHFGSKEAKVWQDKLEKQFPAIARELAEPSPPEEE
ncbi:MAG TPA: hypothetical protein PLI95_27725 [Polyangiaceae bacterium]|nr:hypothetical protein [Polyangiaceae bacterium]